MIRNSTATETCPVSTSTCQNFARVKRRRARARQKAPSAPTAPASMGVNTPLYKPPSTSRISAAMGNAFLLAEAMVSLLRRLSSTCD
ncbi:hypothetical protein D9M68_880670 [compost metagenome]